VGLSCRRSQFVWRATDGWTDLTSAPSAGGLSAERNVRKIVATMQPNARYFKIKNTGNSKVDFTPVLGSFND